MEPLTLRDFALAGVARQLGPDEDTRLEVQFLRQALENLVSNAIKHSPPDTWVLIKLTSELIKGTEYAHVDVVDRGSGVPPEILPRIFDRFVTDGNASGIGLGLYLASRIAAAHGATLAVSSPPGSGATFRLSLPASRPPVRREQP